MEEEHVHCLSCFNHRCVLRPEPGVSCDVINCPLLCGAVFHSCKAAEHQMLCALTRIPCLNSGYGCPAVLARNQMYAHLEVCPAGVVCCTMEWNRCPVSCLDYTSYESLSRGVEEAEQLDMALALQDQRTLLESLKVVSIAPSSQEEPLVTESAESPLASSPPPPGSAKEKILSGINGLDEEPFSELYEATVETARTLAAALDLVSSSGELGRECANAEVTLIKSRRSGQRSLQNRSEDQPGSELEGLTQRFCLPSEETGFNSTLGAGAPSTGEVEHEKNADASEEEVDFADLMILPVGHEGATMEKKVPDRRKLDTESESDRVLYRPRPKRFHKSVDTSDLQQDDDPLGLGEIDLITAALLFCLEESRECRRISDTVYVDSHRVDFGTQTFTFPAAILVTNTRVGDMASASACDHAAPQISYPSPYRTLRLGLVLGALEVEAVPHNRYLPDNPRYQHTFPFVCGQSFRRDQFSSHFINVHGDIHAGLNGWMEHRCPLAYYGCTFSQRRFYPSTLGAKVVHDKHLRSFGVQPCPTVAPPTNSQSYQFSRLPMEIMWHIAGFLDSFSLYQLSLVSRTMREVCASRLQTRGIVELQWVQRPCLGPKGTVSWQLKNKVWRFSTAFSPVSWWGFSDIPSMSNHLKKCPFNTVEHRTEAVPLLCTARPADNANASLPT
ncbi:F-box only protein 30b [Gouania willdenowi]|uniref:F-box only protein 30b n=1 Tax=Gouania willdenowi TaxID=441366 RepID=UPI00105548B5|nr:F-box only protein 30-like [Gouania willdenowi]XP_028295500.1 F-box only protein 30-like [Gouania willdenowi]